MAVREILILGDPRLYEKCKPVRREELAGLHSTFEDLGNTLLDFRKYNGFGRAIAAPQIDVLKRLVYWHVDRPQVIINPVLSDLSQETFELWDDCLSLPELVVRVNRHRSCTVRFLDENWNEQVWQLSDDLSQLMQHEYDHLEGILATRRAVDSYSLAFRSTLVRQDI
ncbi:MAG: peptide deformylase [Candidatus Zixiibacteriota bacterium]